MSSVVAVSSLLSAAILLCIGVWFFIRSFSYDFTISPTWARIYAFLFIIVCIVSSASAIYSFTNKNESTKSLDTSSTSNSGAK